MSSPQRTGDAFDTGRVVQRTIKILGESPALITMSALFLVGAPRFIAMLGGDNLLAPRSSAAFWLSLTGAGLGAVGGIILQGAIIYASVNGRSTPDARAIAAIFVGVRVFPRLLRLGLCTFLGVALGLVLAIVPGLVLATTWIVAAPVLVIERRGVVQSLRHSCDLTRGVRWRIFGLLTAMAGLLIIISLFVEGLGLALAKALSDGAGARLAILLLASVLSAIQCVIAFAATAAIHAELRAVKDGARR